MSKSTMWNWVKRLLGFAVTSVAVPIVTQKYGPEAGATVATVGYAITHQVDKFGGKKPAGESGE
jgi:hypothetical protein